MSNEKANIIIREAKKSNIFPIIFIKYYITKGLGAEWILGLKKTLVKSFIESPKPKENIIKARDNGRITSVTIPTFYFYHFFNKKK